MSTIYVGKEYIALSDEVRLFTADGEFVGHVHSIDETNETNHKIILKNVLLASSGKKFHGVLTFFENEIVKAEVLKRGSTTENVENLENSENKLADNPLKKPALNPLNRPPLSTFTSSLKKKETERFENVGVCETEIENDDLGNCRFKDSKLTVINHMDKLFTDAIDYINTKKVIGVAAEGINIGRKGQLFLLQIDTDTTVFLFDFVSNDIEFINRGLGEILKNPKILKVMHDCRKFSDCLFNQYGYKLVSLYDTQVADALIYKKNNDGNYPRYVRNLPRCLQDYLKLQSKDIYYPQTRATHADEDQLIWSERPIPRHLIDAAIKNVVYLRNLRIATLDRFHNELVEGFKVYISDLRDATDEEVEESANHLLPKKFQELTGMVKYNSNNYAALNRNLFDKSGFKLNSIRIPDPRFRFSRDSCQNGTYNELEAKSSQDLKNVLTNAKQQEN